jgi:hypothetical protein
MAAAQFAFSYIDWMYPLTHGFIFIKLLLLPAAGVYALAQRRKSKRSGIEAHESPEDRKPRAMWVNHTLDAPADTVVQGDTPSDPSAK